MSNKPIPIQVNDEVLLSLPISYLATAKDSISLYNGDTNHEPVSWDPVMGKKGELTVSLLYFASIFVKALRDGDFNALKKSFYYLGDDIKSFETFFLNNLLDIFSTSDSVAFLKDYSKSHKTNIYIGDEDSVISSLIANGVTVRDGVGLLDKAVDRAVKAEKERDTYKSIVTNLVKEVGKYGSEMGVSAPTALPAVQNKYLRDIFNTAINNSINKDNSELKITTISSDPLGSDEPLLRTSEGPSIDLSLIEEKLDKVKELVSEVAKGNETIQSSLTEQNEKQVSVEVDLSEVTTKLDVITGKVDNLTGFSAETDEYGATIEDYKVLTKKLSESDIDKDYKIRGLETDVRYLTEDVSRLTPVSTLDLVPEIEIANKRATDNGEFASELDFYFMKAVKESFPDYIPALMSIDRSYYTKPTLLIQKIYEAVNFNNKAVLGIYEALGNMFFPLGESYTLVAYPLLDDVLRPMVKGKGYYGRFMEVHKKIVEHQSEIQFEHIGDYLQTPSAESYEKVLQIVYADKFVREHPSEALRLLDDMLRKDLIDEGMRRALADGVKSPQYLFYEISHLYGYLKEVKQYARNLKFITSEELRRSETLSRLIDLETATELFKYLREVVSMTKEDWVYNYCEYSTNNRTNVNPNMGLNNVTIPLLVKSVGQGVTAFASDVRLPRYTFSLSETRTGFINAHDIAVTSQEKDPLQGQKLRSDGYEFEQVFTAGAVLYGLAHVTPLRENPDHVRKELKDE